MNNMAEERLGEAPRQTCPPWTWTRRTACVPCAGRSAGAAGVGALVQSGVRAQIGNCPIELPKKWRMGRDYGWLTTRHI